MAGTGLQPPDLSEEEALMMAIAASQHPPDLESLEAETLAAAILASQEDMLAGVVKTGCVSLCRGSKRAAEVASATNAKETKKMKSGQSSSTSSSSSGGNNAASSTLGHITGFPNSLPIPDSSCGPGFVTQTEPIQSCNESANSSQAALGQVLDTRATEGTDDSGPYSPRDEWVVVVDAEISPTRQEYEWLKGYTKVTEEALLETQLYTDHLVWNDLLQRRTADRAKETTLRFCTMPSLEPEWSNSTREVWLHVPGSTAEQDNFNFQRVWISDSALSPSRTVRVLVEWNPLLALEHMALKLGFHALHLQLSCQVTPTCKSGWEQACPAVEYCEPNEDEFFLRGCASEAMAAQPPRFTRFPLRSEQLRSLRWMLDREARPAHFDAEVEERFIPGMRWRCQPQHHTTWTSDYWQAYESRSGFPWCYNAKLRAQFRAAGGVLGDAIGSGKTATLIGLLDTQRSLSNVAVSSVLPEADHLIPCNATLILVPSNLLGQWECEFKKFLGRDAFKFLIIRSIVDLRALTVQELTECEIVLSTYKLLYSPNYIERLKSLQCTRANRLHERSFLGQPIEHTLAEVEKAQATVVASNAEEVGWTMRHKNDNERNDDRCANKNHNRLLTPAEVERRIELLGACQDVKKMVHPVLELFLWRRIVFDEFHELEAMDKRRRSMLQNLRARHRWGLTGTPPKRDTAQVAELARMLRVHVSENDHAQCQHFLDVFARQSFSELPEIPVEEHVVFVQQTMEEHALYLQREFDNDRGKLLQFCSHHCLLGKDEVEPTEVAHDGCPRKRPSARNSIMQLEKHKLAKYSEQKECVTAEYKILAALSSAQKHRHNGKRVEAEAATRLTQLEEEARAVCLPDLQNFLSTLPSTDDYKPNLLQSAGDIRDPLRQGGGEEVIQNVDPGRRIAQYKTCKAHTSQVRRCSNALAKLLSMARSLRFFEVTLGVLLGADTRHTAPECPVCLETITPETTAVLPCSHAFHFKCVCQLMAASSMLCPNCRAPFKRGEVATFQAACKSPSSDMTSSDRHRFGSKLAKIGQILQGIQKQEPFAKAIVFVQWKELEDLISEALTQMGVGHLRLRGTTKQRSDSIEAFQELPEPRTLLLSLENSASGTNLTRASHVLLVHPMDAVSRERAVAYEMQALGRVRRCGQTASPVHLWRFVTLGTVEEDISKRHQLGMSEGIRVAAEPVADRVPSGSASPSRRPRIV